MAQRAQVDDRRARAKLRKVTPVAERAAKRARSDAARQSRTRAQKGIRAELNLPASEIRARLRIVRKGGGAIVDVRASYAPVPAHKFNAWRYVARQAGRLVRETARVARFASRGTAGLYVRFYRNRAPLHFPRAFRSNKIGGGKVFVQRKLPSTKHSRGRPAHWVPNLPLEAITGPSPHQAFADGLNVYAEHGRAAYRRRLEYWLDEYARRAQLK